nr:GNAT family N-acetyltransferase [Pontibacter liquoris]
MFNPPLSDFIKLTDYAYKLYNKAHFITAIEANVLVGLCAFYDNDPSRQEAFLSLFYVDLEYRSQGIGMCLLNNMKDVVKEKGFQELRLEVISNNIRAIHLYKSLGFEAFIESNDRTLMKMKL